MERQIPTKYQGMYNRRKKSRKAAIRSQCMECVGYSEVDVKLCTDHACPLFKWRLRGWEMKTKICSYCQVSKPATSEFFYSRSDRKALDYQCRKCRRLIANAKYAKAHPNMKKYKLKPPKPPAIFRWRPKVGQQFRAYLKVERIHHEHKFSPFICMGHRGRIVQAEHRRIKFDLNCDKFYFVPIK